MNRFTQLAALALGLALSIQLTGCSTMNSTLIVQGVAKQTFGVADGQTAELFTLTNRNGLVAKLTNYGAILTELQVPDRSGKLADVVLGFDSFAEGYDKNPAYFGATVGRVANRIAKAQFTLDGKPYQLAVNNGPNTLHGGKSGFDKRIWHARPITTAAGPAIIFTYLSRDGEEGYPGNLTTTVIYTLTHNNELIVEMSAESDAPTIVNLAHHTYWNLAGHDSGTILDHVLTIHADRYTPVDSTLIPTGELAPVAKTPFDFTEAKPIGRDIPPASADAKDPGGYDHNFVLRGKLGELHPAAKVTDPKSGRTMELLTTEPGMQLYTGNFLDGSIHGKGGVTYNKNAAFCLETQHYPDSIHHEGDPNWPTIILRPGQTYRHVMVHKFTAE